jgi:peptidoglycan/LPS O-acetylase OafA/YrhL
MLQVGLKRLRDFFRVSNDRTAAMDGVRGLAVLIVFLSHSSWRQQALTPFLQFQGIGHIGVYLFFVLSGYLLADHLFHEYALKGNISIQKFLIRRCCRILPLYYFVLTAIIIYQQSTGKIHRNYLHINEGWTGYFKHLLFYKGDGLFWTLPAEFVFYFLLPFVVLLVVRYEVKAIFWMIGVMVTYFIWFLLVTWQVMPVAYAPKLVDISHRGQFLDVFLCGILAAWIARTQDFKSFLLDNRHHLDKLGLITLATLLTASCILVSYKFLGFDRPAFAFRWLSLPIGLAFGVVIISISANGKVKSFFQSGILRFMGVVGFSWYLTHFLVFQIVNTLAYQPSIRFALSFITCAVLSSVLFICIEKPFIRLGKQLTK